MLGSITFSDDIPAGTKLYLATWMNENEGGTYLSVRATWPQERTESSEPRQTRRATRDLDDEIPF